MKATELLNTLLLAIDWHDFSEEDPKYCDEILSRPYLILIELNEPRLDIAYWNGADFMIHDDVSLSGPVYGVTYWASL